MIGAQIAIERNRKIYMLAQEACASITDYGTNPSSGKTTYFIDHVTDKKGKTAIIDANAEAGIAVESTLISCGKLMNPVCMELPEDTSVMKTVFAIDEGSYEFSDVSIKMGEQLTTRQREKLWDLIQQYQGIFSKEKNDIGATQGAEYKVELTSKFPQPANQFALPPDKQQVVSKEIANLLRTGVIEPAVDTDIVTSVFIPIKKNDGSWRIVSDLRSSNNTILKSNYLMPKISDLLNHMAGNKFYVSVDLSKAYWAIKVAKSQRRFFTIQDPVTGRLYQYVRLPMGSKNSAQFFKKRICELIFANVPTENYSNYIDDCCIFAQDFEILLKCLRTVFENYKAHNFKLNLKKCIFGADEVCVFGYVVNSQGIRGDPKKLDGLRKIEIPKTIKQLQQGLGAINYYRRLVPHYSSLAAPLYERLKSKTRTKKSESLEMDDELKKDWDRLMSAFGESVMLQKPDLNARFYVSCDVSQFATGVVLQQKKC